MLNIINKIRNIRYNFKRNHLFTNIEQNNKTEIAKILDFFTNYDGFRTLEACAEYTKIDINLCKIIKKYLYHHNKLGLYYFEAAVPPQKYMQKYILQKFPQISRKSFILEIGPGEYPIFKHQEYKNWYGIDKNYQNKSINFHHNQWATNQYPENKIFQGTFEDITNNLKQNLIGTFDIVCASHTYEHVFQPIKALTEASKTLKSNGALVLFVPDLFTTDPSTKDYTHTLYLTKEMIIEFFHYADCFSNLEIKKYRPNADLVITAIKK